MTLIFWCSLATLIYIYAGYPMLVWLLARCFGRDVASHPVTPSVSLVIPAFNEEAHLEEKLRNSVDLDYPKDRLEVVVASDGSTDRTDAIARQFADRGVRLLAMRDHVGKSTLLDRTIPLLQSDIVVFSDASSQLARDALRQIVAPFADPRVGCVSGLYRLIRGSVGDLRARGEGLYWRYETWIKRQESRLHSILGAHGAFYAIRRSLFWRLDGTAINDDYLIPMRVVAQSYRAVYAPAAVAWERELASVAGEFARRRRIAAGNCQQIVHLRQMLNPRYGWVAFSFFSHKVLRTLAPLFMLAVLASSLWLPQPMQAVALVLQLAFYASAYAGFLCQRRGRVVSWLCPQLYFCLGNLAMLAGLVKYCFSRQPTAWERAR